MGIRIYLCPIIGDGSDQNPYRAEGIDSNYSAVIPSNPDGTPRFPWCVLVSRSSDWTAQDANGLIERIFGIDLPDTIDTWAEVKQFLSTTLVSSIPPARRQAINDRLTARGVDTSSITLQSSFWDVLQVLVRHLKGVDYTGDGIRFI